MTNALVVDDDDAIRLIAKLSLERDGWDVQESSSGRAALVLLEDWSPDIILMDLMMPDMDGRELLAELQAREIGVPVVFISARHDLDKELLGLGAIGVLQKPFNPLTLGESIRELLSKLSG